jgi:hypothetical protein
MVRRRAMIETVKMSEYRENEYHFWAWRRANDRI